MVSLRISQNRYRLTPFDADIDRAVSLFLFEASRTTMWCSTCQQDVPAVAQAVAGQVVCARCHRALEIPKLATMAGIADSGIPLDEEPSPVRTEPLAQFDDWASQQTVRSLGRTLRRKTASSGPRIDTEHQATSRRFDPPQNLFHELEGAATKPLKTSPPRTAPHYQIPSQQPERGQALSWLLVVVGTLLLAAGLVTMGWALAYDSRHLWSWSLGLLLAGQGELVLGLVLVTMRLWRNSRDSTNKLQEVHSQLGQLQHSTDAMVAMRGSSAPAFYAELVRGASPQMLLTNLKGQLDQMAVRLQSDA